MRWGLLLFACCWLLGGSSSAGTPVSAADARPPNIVLILTDDQEVDSLRYMPNVQALLVDQGATFDQFLVNVPVADPSRITLLRGQYAHNTGILTGAGAHGGFRAISELGVDQSTIATWLQAAGYQTALFGRYVSFYEVNRPPLREYIPPGWTAWGVPATDAFPQFNYTLNLNGTFVEYGEREEDYGTDVYAGLAAAFIEQSANADKPFFVELSTFSPHTPATPAPRHAALFAGLEVPQPPSFNEADVTDKPWYIARRAPLDSDAVQGLNARYRTRLQSLQAIDDAVATLVEALTITGQIDNTYIVYSSDNGYIMGQHRLPANIQYPYEEAVRVPLIVRGPGIAAGTTIPQLAGNIDFAPTFAEWAGIAPPEFVDGRSLAPLLTTPPLSTGWRHSFLLSNWNVDPEVGGKPATVTPVPAGQWSDSKPDFQGLRTDQYGYIEYADGEREFYDLDADPYQLENLAGSADAGFLAALHTRLAALQSCRAESCRAIENEPIA